MEDQLELPMEYPEPSSFGELFQEVFGDNLKYVKIPYYDLAIRITNEVS